jgi:hypothetical protein
VAETERHDWLTDETTRGLEALSPGEPAGSSGQPTGDSDQEIARERLRPALAGSLSGAGDEVAG